MLFFAKQKRVISFFYLIPEKFVLIMIAEKHFFCMIFVKSSFVYRGEFSEASEYFGVLF